MGRIARNNAAVRMVEPVTTFQGNVVVQSSGSVFSARSCVPVVIAFANADAKMEVLAIPKRVSATVHLDGLDQFAAIDAPLVNLEFIVIKHANASIRHLVTT